MKINKTRIHVVVYFIVIILAVLLLSIWQKNIITHSSTSLAKGEQELGTVYLAKNSDCPSDANKLITYQRSIALKEEEMDKRMSNMPHSEYDIITLSKSAYSNKLHTCVAVINVSMNEDNVKTIINQIYITPNNKILAQYSIPDKYNTNFLTPLEPIAYIPTTFNMANWTNYEKFLGLN